MAMAGLIFGLLTGLIKTNSSKGENHRETLS